MKEVANVGCCQQIACPFQCHVFFPTNGIAIAVEKASFCCNWLLEETFLASSV